MVKPKGWSAMRGLPILFVVIVVINIVVRLIKAANEGRQSDEDWNNSGDDSEWSDWTAGNKPAAPPQSFIPPKPPVSRSTAHPRPVIKPGTRRQAAMSAHVSHPGTNKPRATTLQQLLSDVRQAVEAPKAPPPPPPAVRSTVAQETKSVFTDMPEVDAPPIMPGQLTDSEMTTHLQVAADAIDAAFPEESGGGMIQRHNERPLRLKIKGKRDLRRAVLVREVLDRPRAFDM
ncbi:MAG: hypothetical protein RRC34_02425 [Lentisphaeria bacterium]|nr:hypothetical protein [Lentisphaeria bacterium]